MLIFLHGPDSYRRNEKLKGLVGKYREKYREKADFMEVDLEENIDMWQGILDFMFQPSMFVASKVAVVKNATLIDKKEWIEKIKKVTQVENTFLILSEETKKPKKAFSFLLDKPVNFQFFEELSGSTLLVFIKKECEKRKISLEKETLSLLVSYVKTIKNRSSFVVNELEKISLARLSQPVRINDLTNITNWTIREEMYITTRRLLQTRDQKSRLIVLNQLLAGNEDPSYIFNMIAFQTKEGPATRLADIDTDVKSGKLDYESALLKFCL